MRLLIEDTKAEKEMLEANQTKITEIHHKIHGLYQEINQIREEDKEECKQLRRANSLFPEWSGSTKNNPEYRKLYHKLFREKYHFGENLWKRWQKWEVDLIESGRLPTEIAKVTGRSILAVESKIFKMQHQMNKKDF